MSTTTQGTTVKRDRTHYLYIAVIVAVVLGAVVGLVFPDFAVGLKWIGTTFVALIKMMIQPVIFCTLVHRRRLGAQRGQRRQGRRPRARLLPDHVDRRPGASAWSSATCSTRARASTSPTTSPGSARSRPRRRRLDDRVHHRHRPRLAALVADLRRGPPDPARRAARRLRPAGDGPRRPSRSSPASATCSAWSSGCSSMIMWAAPVGAFAAIAAVVGETGVDALKSLATHHGRLLPHLLPLRLRRARHASSSWSPASTSSASSSTSAASSC